MIGKAKGIGKRALLGLGVGGKSYGPRTVRLVSYAEAMGGQRANKTENRAWAVL